MKDETQKTINEQSPEPLAKGDFLISEKVSDSDKDKDSEKTPESEGKSFVQKFEGRSKKIRSNRPKEFDQKIINIRRVTRVVAGGRRLSFAVTLLIGDKKGSVGLGNGKAIDTALAIAKALRQAKKNMFAIKTTPKMSITHEVSAKFGSSRVFLMPNKARGLVVGSSMRDVLKLGGLHDITAKINSGSKNKLNIARATIEALKTL